MIKEVRSTDADGNPTSWAWCRTEQEKRDSKIRRAAERNLLQMMALMGDPLAEQMLGVCGPQ